MKQRCTSPWRSSRSASAAGPRTQPHVRPLPAPVPSISQRPTGIEPRHDPRRRRRQQHLVRLARRRCRRRRSRALTFSEALAKADAASSVDERRGVEHADRSAPKIPKPLDYRLQPGERNAVIYRLRELNQQILAYRVDTSAPTRRRAARSSSSPKRSTRRSSSPAPTRPTLAELDKLAEEFGINVALESKSDPKAARAPRSKAAASASASPPISARWMQAGIKPVDGLATVKDRLLLVSAADRSALGAKDATCRSARAPAASATSSSPPTRPASSRCRSSSSRPARPKPTC